jgi:two-component system sensor histidine kinase TctE
VKRVTLRGRLLRWLLVVFGVLGCADVVDMYFRARSSADELYDRALFASALAIFERVSLAGGNVDVDIPPLALEVLDSPSHEHVFYRVGYRVQDREEALLTGYDDLPGPPGGAARPGSAWRSCAGSSRPSRGCR